MTGTTRSPCCAEKRRNLVAHQSNRTVDPDAHCPGITGLAALCAVGTRVKILLALSKEPLEVGVLAAHVGRDVAHVSHHLRPLSEAGLIQPRRHRLRVVYVLNPAIMSVEKRDDGFFVRYRCSSGLEVHCRLPWTE